MSELQDNLHLSIKHLSTSDRESSYPGVKGSLVLFAWYI